MRPKITIPVALALALALSLPCLAQTTQIFIVDKNPASPNYHTIQAAINDGVILSRAGTHVEIHVLASLGAYTENLLIPADADIGLFGVPRNKPWRVPIIAGSSTSPVIMIDASLPRPPDAPTDRIIIDGFELRSGVNGVHIMGAAGAGTPDVPAGARYAPTISRCYIRLNQQNGVLIEGDAQPLIVNCSIVENIDNGILVNTTHTASDRMPDVLFCSIIMNGHRGVYVKGTQNARVRNTLVYRNGPEQQGAFVNPNDGGLVWESDLFIRPDFGPVQGGGLPRYIFGTNLGDVTTTDVYFGPPSIPGTRWTKLPLSVAGAAAGAALEGTVPPAYLGVPGPVPVHIERIGSLSGQPFRITVPDGYRYISDDTTTAADDDENRPAITLVLPQNGPPEGQNWVSVFGVNFDSNCRVAFDFDPPGSPPGDGLISRSPNDEQSPRVIWMSSGELLVKVPANPFITTLLPNQKVDVIVENLDSSLSSVPPSPRTDPMKDYEYRLKDAAIDMTIPYAWQPNIVQIVPNFCITPEGNMTVSIVGWDFECNALVKFGNIICPYKDVIKGAPFPAVPPPFPNPASPAYPHTFDEIEGVVVPVAEFGTGGSYDVEVINPTGHHDVLVNGFTYYSDGVPRLDPSAFKWRPANFRRYDPSTTSPSEERRLLGTDFDTGITVTFNPTPGDPAPLSAFPGFDPTNPAAHQPLTGNDIDNVLIQEARQQHQRHSQREIVFNMPPAQDMTHSPNPFPDDFIVPIPSRTIPLQIWNRSGTDGSNTIATTADDTKNTEVTHFVWATDGAVGLDEGLYFEVRNIQQICAATVIYADVYNWQGLRAPGAGNGMDVFVENTLVNAGVTPTAAGASLGIVTTITIDLSLVTLPQGLAGPVDLTVVLPDGQPYNNSGEDLYFVVEDAFFLEPPGPTCLPNDHAWQIYGRAIEPRAVPATPPAPPAVPDAQPIEVHIYGSFFHGPAFGGTGGQGIWTNAIIVDPATGIPTWPISALSPSYEVVSSEEIKFTAFDVTASTITPVIPLDTQLDVMLQNECSGAVQYVTDTMTGAILFSTRLVPDITDVYVPPPPSDRRWGTVEGGTDLTVEGDNFHPKLTGGSKVYEPRVRINGVAVGAFTGSGYNVPGFKDFITFATPPAPYGLPATYPVSVITRMTVTGQDWVFEAMAPEPLWYTYVMDGAPHISDVSPNHVDADAADAGNVYFTITGSNFDDQVELLIDARDATGQFDGVAEIIPGPKFFSISPFEIVVIAPSPTDLRPNLFFGPDDVAITMVYVKNGTGSSDIAANPDHLISNGLPLLYYHGNQGLQPRTPQLGFNDAYLNYRDYVNAAPGLGSISVDPLLDPGQTQGLPNPIMKILRTTTADWWLGKLALISQIYASYSQYWNPLCEKAAEINLTPFTDEDLELDSRPQPAPGAQGTGPTAAEALPDIGADEILSAAAYGDVAWYYASVSPDPVGAVPAGGLYVEVAIRGDAIDPDPNKRPIFFYLPQGVLPPAAGANFVTWMSNHDYLRLDVLDEGSYTEAGDAFYAMTNAVAITTVLEDTNGSGTPTAGDVIADGHAAVFMAVDIDGSGAIDPPDEVVGYNPNNLGDLSDRGFIRDQAVAGRHFLIDTIPPRIHIETYTSTPNPNPNPLSNAIVAADLIYTHNDLYTANSFWVPPPGLNPYWVPPPFNLAAPTNPLTPGNPLTRWDPANVDAPQDYLGEIRFFDDPPLAGADASVGTQIFFNVASAVGLFQNNPTLDNLYMGVCVYFIDPPVCDASTPSPYVLDISDIFIPALKHRQVAGFSDDPRNPDPNDTTSMFPGALESGIAKWFFVDGSRFLVDPRVQVASRFLVSGEDVGPPINPTNPSAPNEGFWVNEADNTATTDIFRRELLEATWTFPDGIDWKLAYDNVFHVVAQFIAQDAAGNATAGPEDVIPDPPYPPSAPADVRGIPDPLQIWWLINVQTKFTPNLEGRTLVNPTIQWALNRDSNPVVRSENLNPLPTGIPPGPRPIYTFRFWVADEYGGNVDPLSGQAVYKLLTDWGPGSDEFYPWALYPPDYPATLPEVPGGVEHYLGGSPLAVPPGLGIPEDRWRDRWILIVLVSADEAGNVEPWPSGELTLNPDETVSISASNGVNWMRFYLGGRGLPEAKIEADLWYDSVPSTPWPPTLPNLARTREPREKDLGAAKRVYVPAESLNQHIEAGFTITVDLGEPPVANPMVYWELIESGTVIASDTLVYPFTLRQNQVVLPFDDLNIGTFDGRVRSNNAALQYTFKVTAFSDSNGSGDLDPGDPRDPSPALYTFIVMPEISEADSFNRLDTEDTQPIKIQEEK